MFQRTFLRQAQAARSVLSVRSSASTLRRTSQLQPQLPAFRPLARQPAYRFYSTENKAENGKEEQKEGEGESDPLRAELEKKEKEVVELKDKYVRSVADFLNLQERTKRDMDSARNFAIQRFSIDLLESIDNFDRALLAVPADKLSAAATESNKDLLDLVDGLKMTQNILMNTLQKHGLQRFDPSAPTEEGKTQKFDPNLHEATFMAKAEGKEDGDIMYTQSKGFMLNGRVIRAAKVGVVNNN
ncbi:GrpE-domain-containing protein [Aspergillus campestris IBT 28561]|uniref:GrpE protein homolog n=1 Tax=Aspergillus campestris (strain IBT 28561) TaxID=1392248 RepID=A0A2I1CVJ8_ASPC2|nr:GrpE-domain-containing protein [Aspergillus campestris IBT 28561]PKY01657.1 GrpE-domain-containing protein [Aspergillus campestris IBT 28561]